jgi:hypothetical protein
MIVINKFEFLFIWLRIFFIPNMAYVKKEKNFHLLFSGLWEFFWGPKKLSKTTK